VAPALDVRLLAFAAALTAVTGVTIGLAPALQLPRGASVSVKHGGAAGGRSQLFGNLLVSAQVAVAVALLLGTGYFARALGRAMDVDTGFDADRVVMVGMNTDLVQRDREETVALREAAVQRAAALPGVTAVSWTGNIPLTASFDRQTSVVEGYTPSEGERVRFEYVGVGPRYHEVLGIPILRGRGFDERDLGPGERVAVINQTAADRYFAGRDPLGLTIRMGEETLRVVGVARDALYHALGEEPRPYLYFPLSDMRQDIVLARVERDAAALVPELERAVRSATPGVPVIALGTLNDRLHAVLAPQVNGAWLLGAFGALALIIALVGIYGVLAYTVERRTREIGIRIAIGARAADVVRSVVLRGATLVSLGVVGGLVLGVLLGRGARSFLFGVPASDPVTLATTAGIMLLVGVVAAWVPARRAVGVDPSTALRTDA
jgi:predicted permease